MNETIALATIALFANKVIEWIKYLRNQDWNAAITLAAVWAAGVVAMLIAAAATVTKLLVLPGADVPLGAMDFWSKVLVGLSFTSSTSTLYDFKKAFDRTDSAKQPPLVQ